MVLASNLFLVNRCVKERLIFIKQAVFLNSFSNGFLVVNPCYTLKGTSLHYIIHFYKLGLVFSLKVIILGLILFNMRFALVT